MGNDFLYSPVIIIILGHDGTERGDGQEQRHNKKQLFKKVRTDAEPCARFSGTFISLRRQCVAG